MKKYDVDYDTRKKDNTKKKDDTRKKDNTKKKMIR